MVGDWTNARNGSAACKLGEQITINGQVLSIGTGGGLVGVSASDRLSIDYVYSILCVSEDLQPYCIKYIQVMVKVLQQLSAPLNKVDGNAIGRVSGDGAGQLPPQGVKSAGRWLRSKRQAKQ